MSYQYSQVIQPVQTYDSTDALASYGRFKTYMSSFVLFCVVLSLCFIGGIIINLSVSTTPNTKNTTGIVTQITNGYKVKYFVNNTNYENPISLSYIPALGETIDITYDVNNPNNIYEYKSKIKGIGYGSVFICCGLFICILMSLNLYSVNKYKTAAIDSALTPTYNTTSYNPYGRRQSALFNPTIVL